VVRKEALLAAGGLNPSLRIHEGIDLWLRLAERHDFDYVDKVLCVTASVWTAFPTWTCWRASGATWKSWTTRPDLFAADSPRVRQRHARIFERMGRTLLSRGDYP
jgi:hypothetical protein